MMVIIGVLIRFKRRVILWPTAICGVSHYYTNKTQTVRNVTSFFPFPLRMHRPARQQRIQMSPRRSRRQFELGKKKDGGGIANKHLVPVR